MSLQTIANSALAVMLGAIGGGLFSAYVGWRLFRENTARELLSEALAIQASMEAWILDGPDYKSLKLSENRNLLTEPLGNKNWLRKVEIRAVLDECRWNAPSEQYYGFIEGRRSWIVRDKIEDMPSHTGVGPGDYHPALISSRAFEELCGWIECVISAQDGWLLSHYGLKMLRPLLTAVATEDRVAVFRIADRLSPRALNFLKWYREKYMP